MDNNSNIQYVATLEHTAQVGFEQSQTFHQAKILNGTETVAEIMQWGKSFMRQPEILIVVAT